MTQLQLVLSFFAAKPKASVKEVADKLRIKEPNIRRILGQGAIKGTFKREERGVYTIVTESGEKRAYIQMGKAEEALPVMAAEGRKFDSVFVDIPYFSRALIGGNRGIKDYAFMHPEQFAKSIQAIHAMLASPDSHVYLMLSGAPSAQKDMDHYLRTATDHGLTYIAEGKYTKLFGNGMPVTNVRGEVASAERLILLTKSGYYRNGEISELQLDFEVQRPSIKRGYPTQKAEVMLERIIKQSTFEDEAILDPCAGSGKYGVMGYMLKRIVTLIEPLQTAIDNFILPNFKTVI